MKNIYSITDEFVQMRLDKWIKKTISNIPQSLIEKNIRKGNIKINNEKQKSSYKLKKMIKLYSTILAFHLINIKKRLIYIFPARKKYPIHQIFLLKIMKIS